MMLEDGGLQRERTVHAWRRSSLSALVVSAMALHAFVTTGSDVLVVVLLVVLVMAALAEVFRMQLPGRSEWSAPRGQVSAFVTLILVADVVTMVSLFA